MMRFDADGTPYDPLVIFQLDEECDPDVHIGLIPSFLDLDDPRPAAEQFNERYVYGGWRNQPGFKKSGKARLYYGGDPPLKATLHYPGDPPLDPLALIPFREERIFIYRHAYVAIFQLDGSFEACRMD
jgi:hypothetical protein